MNSSILPLRYRKEHIVFVFDDVFFLKYVILFETKTLFTLCLFFFRKFHDCLCS